MTDSDSTHRNSDVTTRRGVRSFVIRQGRMTEGQRKAYERAWPRYGLTREQGVIDPREVFGRDAPLNLEIGFGMGQSLAEMAAAAPEQDFIGVEVHTPGVGALLKSIEEQELENIRIYSVDANDVIDLCLPDACLDRVMIFFPRPMAQEASSQTPADPVRVCAENSPQTEGRRDSASGDGLGKLRRAYAGSACRL